MLKTWKLASRPKTLPAAVAPVIIGTAMAYGDGVIHPLAAAIAFICALLIQIATNFVNDYADFKKGTDDPDRIGPLRVTQAGLVTPKQMKRAIWLTFAITIALALYLVVRGGWPIVLIGVTSIVSGILYTEGPYPLGYIGLGDLFVLIFFGPVALAGTYYVQALSIDWTIILAGLGPGFISVAILTVNNLRDIDGDRKAGKKTLAVRFGKGFAMKEYYFSILFAALVPFIIYLFTQRHKWATLAMATLFFAPGVLRTVFSKSDGPSLNNALGQTGKLLLIYGLLFSIGWVVS